MTNYEYDEENYDDDDEISHLYFWGNSHVQSVKLTLEILALVGDETNCDISIYRIVDVLLWDLLLPTGLPEYLNCADWRADSVTTDTAPSAPVTGAATNPTKPLIVPVTTPGKPSFSYPLNGLSTKPEKPWTTDVTNTSPPCRIPLVNEDVWFKRSWNISSL